MNQTMRFNVAVMAALVLIFLGVASEYGWSLAMIVAGVFIWLSAVAAMFLSRRSAEG